MISKNTDGYCMNQGHWDMAVFSFKAWLLLETLPSSHNPSKSLETRKSRDLRRIFDGSCHQGTTGAADAAPAAGRRHTAGADGAAATEIVGCAYRVTSLLSCSRAH